MSMRRKVSNVLLAAGAAGFLFSAGSTAYHFGGLFSAMSGVEYADVVQRPAAYSNAMAEFKNHSESLFFYEIGIFVSFMAGLAGAVAHPKIYEK